MDDKSPVTVLTPEDLAQVEGDELLQLQYVPLTFMLENFWDRNPKKHDFNQIAESIARHGFKDPPKFEPHLNGGRGGTVEGNGRIETLGLMRDRGLAMEVVFAEGRKTPRGIVLAPDGDWAVPMLFGVDAASQQAAEAYGIDHNLVTLGGAGFTSTQLRQIWNEDFLLRVLREQEDAELKPVTWDDLDAIDLLALADQKEDPDAALPSDAGADLAHARELMEKYGVERGMVFCLPSLTNAGSYHRVMCGDSLDPGDVGLLMAGERAVLLHADPPYGMGKEADGIVNDNLYAGKLDRFQMAWWRAWRPFLLDNASAYIWGNPEDLWRLWYGWALRDNGLGLRDSERLTFRNEVVWAKVGLAEGEFDAIGIRSEDMRMFPPCTERSLFFMVGEQGFNTNQDAYWDGWEPLRSYLAGEVEKMGWQPSDVHEITGVMMFGHWFSKSQWVFIRREHYMALRAASNNRAFLRPYDAQDTDALKGTQALQSEHLVLASDYQTLRDQFYGTRAFFDNTHDRLVDVWTFPRVILDERYDHPSPKPVELVERAIKSSAPQGGLVASPFVGTGTDVAAAERTRRVCCAMDISERWVAVTLERMAKMGLTPYVADRREYNA